MKQHSDPNDGPAEIWKRITAKQDELEKDMKSVPVDRLGSYMEMRSIEAGYLERLMFAMKAQAILDICSQEDLYEAVREFKSETELLWWHIQSNQNWTTCELLDQATLETQFTFEKLTEDQDLGEAVVYQKPLPFVDQVKAITANVPKAQVGLDAEKKHAQHELDNESDETQRSILEKTIDLLEEANLKLDNSIDAMKTAANDSVTQATHIAAMQKRMEGAMDSQRPVRKGCKRCNKKVESNLVSQHNKEERIKF